MSERRWVWCGETIETENRIKSNQIKPNPKRTKSNKKTHRNNFLVLFTSFIVRFSIDLYLCWTFFAFFPFVFFHSFFYVVCKFLLLHWQLYKFQCFFLYKFKCASTKKMPSLYAKQLPILRKVAWFLLEKKVHQKKIFHHHQFETRCEHRFSDSIYIRVHSTQVSKSTHICVTYAHQPYKVKKRECECWVEIVVHIRLTARNQMSPRTKTFSKNANSHCVLLRKEEKRHTVERERERKKTPSPFSLFLLRLHSRESFFVFFCSFLLGLRSNLLFFALSPALRARFPFIISFHYNLKH